VEWALDLATAWAKVELMTTMAHTVTLEGSLNARRVSLALPGELYSLVIPVCYRLFFKTILFALIIEVVSYVTV
jgi:hypothetical protein